MAPSRKAGRLGLSLAGGGFRASLFHVGVLRRLAELDVLRRVEVLSTVSGGSITGALYVLLLKKYLERAQPRPAQDGAPVVSLSRDEYIEIVCELEQLLVRGVQKNLRTRLLMNPLGTLLVLVTGDSLSRRMARLYERHLLCDVVKELRVAPAPWWRPRWLWPGQIRMKELVVRPGGLPITEGLGAYNTRQRAVGGSAVTSIMINATSLNSGGRFCFSAVELGDWYLGYFRESEFDQLLARKSLLALDDDALRAVAVGGEAARVAALALRHRTSAHVVNDDAWSRLFDVPTFPGMLDQAAFGLLRPAKLAAWYLRVGRTREPPVLGGLSVDEHTAALWAALRVIDPDVEAQLRTAVLATPTLINDLADYLLELYLLRTAERASHRIATQWDDIRVGHAVGASACFPPVFPPFLVYGIYDDLHVPRLGLTDGGVYDNMGVTALLDEGCTEIIASDTSGLFNTKPVSAGGQVGLALRIPDLLMRALGGLQRSGLRERRRVSRILAELAAEQTPLQQELAMFQADRALDALVYFHISSPRVDPAEPQDMHGVVPPLRIDVDPLDIARLRTDLDGFGDVEVAALVNHGYDMADRHVRRYAPDLIDVDIDPPRQPRAFDGPNATRARSRLILEVGGARFFRALKLRTPVATAFTAVAAAAVLMLAWRQQLTIETIVGAVAAVVQAEVGLLSSILETVLRVPPPASQSPMVMIGLLGVVVVLVLWRAARRTRKSAAQGRPRPFVRRLITFRKWFRALSGNLLWGLLGLPAIIAGVGAVMAWVSYLFFHLPFMRAVRIPREAHGRSVPRHEHDIVARRERAQRGAPAGGG